MKNHIIIILVLLGSCDTQYNDSNRNQINQIDSIVKQTASVNTDSVNGKVESESNGEVVIKKSTVDLGKPSIATQNTFCPEINKLLKKVNWRKHPKDDCFVVELDSVTSLNNFVSQLYRHRLCLGECKLLEIEDLFGKYIERRVSNKDLVYSYPIVESELLSKDNQPVCEFFILSSNSSYSLPEFVETTIQVHEIAD